MRSRFLLLMVSTVALFSIWACGNKAQPQPSAAQAGPKNFASPDDAGKALFEAAKSGNQEAVAAIFGTGSKDIISTGNAADDKASRAGFAQAASTRERRPFSFLASHRYRLRRFLICIHDLTSPILGGHVERPEG